MISSLWSIWLNKSHSVSQFPGSCIVSFLRPCKCVARKNVLKCIRIMRFFLFSIVNNSAEVIPQTVFTCGSFLDVSNQIFKIWNLNCYFPVRISSRKTPPLMKKLKGYSLGGLLGLQQSICYFLKQYKEAGWASSSFFFNPLQSPLISLLYSNSHSKFPFIL